MSIPCTFEAHRSKKRIIICSWLYSHRTLERKFCSLMTTGNCVLIGWF
jgi:hypothetical protein